MTKEILKQKEKVQKETTERDMGIITLFFQRTDDLDKDVLIRTTSEERMELVVKRAAKKLDLTNSKIGVLVEGQPISFTEQTVGDVIETYDAVSYQISSADMLGSWQEREEEEEGEKRRKSDEVSTPPTGAGLLRFYDQETGGPKIGGRGVMILAALFLGSVLAAWFFV